MDCCGFYEDFKVIESVNWPCVSRRHYTRTPHCSNISKYLLDQKVLICYRPQRSCGKAMFLHRSVCHSVHREVFGSHHPLDKHPPGRHLPGSQPLLRQTTPPPPRRPLQRTVRILLECILIITMGVRENFFSIFFLHSLERPIFLMRI